MYVLKEVNMQKLLELGFEKNVSVKAIETLIEMYRGKGMTKDAAIDYCIELLKDKKIGQIKLFNQNGEIK